MSDDEGANFDAVMIESVGWVRPVHDNLVAFELSDGQVSNVFVLDGEQAERLAEGLMAHLPPPPGTTLGMEFAEGLPSTVQVDDVGVQAPQSRTQQGDQEPFEIRFSSEGRTALTLRMSHREVMRWYRFLGAQISEHHRRHSS